jgi:uncharacterized membrane protein HdeD (DUF308 family)
MTNMSRARVTSTVAWLIITLAAASALLPLDDHLRGPALMGWLLIAAGTLEVVAGTQRRAARIPAIFAGLATAGVGTLFVTGGSRGLLAAATLVTVWLLLRGLVLVLVTVAAGSSSVRKWTLIAAATDFLLGALLLLGVSIASLVYNLFGPTEQLIASFAWVFALSFVATGTMLLEVANCEREGAA